MPQLVLMIITEFLTFIEKEHRQYRDNYLHQILKKETVSYKYRIW